jgi:uncharacterized protein (TIGR02599 family)
MVSAFKSARRGSGFTLVEMLVCMAIVAVLLVFLVMMTGQTSATWQHTSGKMEQFRQARTAFETLTMRLSQATLNTYWDYDNPALPGRYERRSDLRFIAGQANTLLGNHGNAQRVSHCLFFHSPLGFTHNPAYRGVGGLMNVWGYFVELNDDSAERPPFLSSGPSAWPARTRFRLMELMQPSEELMTYQLNAGSTPIGPNWFKTAVNPPNAGSRSTHVLAENIVALMILPMLSPQDQAALGSSAQLAPNYSYDSTQAVADPNLNPKNQLPPVVQVTMVAIDEQTATRLSVPPGGDNFFGVSGKFQDAAQFHNDLALDLSRGGNDTLENKLVELRANYRVFTTRVPLRAAKWSRAQSN